MATTTLTDTTNGAFTGHANGTFPNGTTYDGEYKDGKRNGQGVETLADGKKYDGEFKDGKAHGKGVYTWPDGQKYDGEFKDGDMHGKGVYTLSDGQKYDGEFTDGKKNGKGVKTLPDGRTYESEWKDGEWTAGKWNELPLTVLPPWKEAYLDAPSSEAEKQEVLTYLATEEKHVEQTLLGLKRKIAALEQPESEPLQKRTRFNSPSVTTTTRSR